MSKKLTQTNLGEVFGLSSIAIGKKLIELNIKDKDTKLATDYAITHNLAKNVSYSKNGENIQMSVYNQKTIDYINNKTKNDDIFFSEQLFGHIKNIKKIEDNDTDGSKVHTWLIQAAYEDFEKLFNSVKNNHTILVLFYKKLEKEKLLDYSKHFVFLKNLDIIANKIIIEQKINLDNIKEKESISKI